MNPRHANLSPRILFACALVLLLPASPLKADLLTPTYQSELESWLGSGPMQFTNIFSAANGDGKTAEDFHAAADGVGPTFTLASVTRGSNTYIVGGYDPQSWNGAGNYNFAFTYGSQDAFIFNLTSDTIQRENHDASGEYQTLDYSGLGPTWGQSFDLTFGDYNGYGPDNLDYGSTFNYSYGGSFGTDILGDPDLFVDGNRGVYDPFTVNVLDVYTLGPAATQPVSGVPDHGGTAAMLGLSLVGIALLVPGRRIAPRQAAA
jgi:TLD